MYYHVLYSRQSITAGLLGYTWLSNVRIIISKLMLATLEEPEVYVVWDGEGAKFTKRKIYNEYKANRDKAPDLINEVREGLELLQHVSNKLCVSVPGVEADDLLYSISGPKIIVTRDADLLQSLDRETRVYNQHTKVLIDSQIFYDTYGFTPDQLPIYKAIVGDTADNWPGVSGWGPKTILKHMGSRPEETMQNLQGKFKPHQIQQFMTGLELVELIKYKIELKDPVNKNNWELIHDKFEIVDTEKATFRY